MEMNLKFSNLVCSDIDDFFDDFRENIFMQQI